MPAFYFTRTKEIQILYNLTFGIWLASSIFLYNSGNLLFFNLGAISLIQIWTLGMSFESANKKSFPDIQEIYSDWFPFLSLLTFLIKN